MSSMSTSRNFKNQQEIAAFRKQTAVSQMKQKQTTPATKAGKKEKTKIVVKCNCGFSNSLYIRGQGIPGLSWDHGMPMKCTKADEWVWETDQPFNNAEFKIVLNDKQYESGKNHNCSCGKSCSIKPAF